MAQLYALGNDLPTEADTKSGVHLSAIYAAKAALLMVFSTRHLEHIRPSLPTPYLKTNPLYLKGEAAYVTSAGTGSKWSMKSPNGKYGLMDVKKPTW